MFKTRTGGTKKENTLRRVPANNVVVVCISVVTVSSTVSCEEMTVYIYLRFMARKCILQTAVVCAVSQARETMCSFVEWSGVEWRKLNYLCLQGSSRRRETSSL